MCPIMVLTPPLACSPSFNHHSISDKRDSKATGLNMSRPPRFRLKNMATSAYVTGVLLDATGPFWKLHKRVLEAGCLVDPEWKLGIQV